MTFQTIKFEKNNHTAVIRLDRPERMNAVNEDMYREIQQALRDIEADETIRALIITGSVLKKGAKEKQAFCAGADLKEHSAGKRTRAQKRTYIELAHQTTHRLYEFPKPVIAAVNGPARGAGAEMALNCDFVIMAETASIAFPEIGLGTFIGGGVTHLLPTMVGMMKAKALIYSGRVLDGKAAVAWGLAVKSVPVENLLDNALQLAEELAEKAPLSIKSAKSRLQDSGSLDMKTVLTLETDAILSCMDTEDWREGAKAFVEKRKPVYKGK
ncbi:MAG: enoyl-CoA hydratase/isomerase family protein [Candidatus Aminicenantes bacterium]|nr:enoyl-CoA hydratase/isomerase family protein [Candidatus Aminicenantes bacterium]